MYTIKMRFWCNAGHTVEKVDIEIDEESDLSEDLQIEAEFLKWLDNNEDVGFERILMI